MRKIKLFLLLLLASGSSYAQHQVTGKVTAGDTGEPIPYASIVLKGETRYTTTTDDAGSYSIAIPSGTGTLVASFVGYQNSEVAVSNRSIVNITLEVDETTLEEVIVVAYGMAPKSGYSGSASVVKADKIKDVPVVSFEQALSGSAAGVTLTSDSGLPGSFPEIRIRGVGSMNAGNNPLYVIDGIPATSGDLSSSNTGTSTMNFLNPSDIESITILKDAAAASLYGSRAANGVVLITTKKGQAGKTQFRFKAEMGFSNFAFNNFPLASDEEHEMLHREAWTNYAQAYPASTWRYTGSPYPTESAYVETQVERYYPSKKPGLVYVDWRKELFQTAITQNYELSVSGGNEKTRFFISTGYNKNEAVSKGRGFDRISGTMNLDHKATKYLNVGVGVQFSNTNQTGYQEGSTAYDNPWWAAMGFVTWRWPAYNADGTYWIGVYDPNNSSYRSPLLNNDTQITESQQTRLLMKPWVEATIVDGLKAKSTFGYDGAYIHDKFGWLPDHANGQAYGDGFLTKKQHEYLKLVSSTTLNYSKTFADDHSLGAMVGWEAEKQSNFHNYMGKVNMASTTVISMELMGKLYGGLYDYNDENSMLSFLSSLNYSYKSKYFFTTTYRKDGSSRLAPNHRWGDFWSVSGSWRVINESFMQNISWLNDLRVRASYGVSGTLPTSWYYYKPWYNFQPYGEDDSALYASAANNPELTWEKNHSMNLALETRVFNRLSISADFYIKTTKDLLMNASTSSISGFNQYLRNVGEMQNKGVELEVNVDIMKNKDITWTAGVNWTYNKNEITKMSYDGEQLVSSTYLLKAGYSYNQYYTREYAGVDPQTGKVQFYRNNKLADGTYNKQIVNDANSANSIIIDGKTGDPKGYGGISTSFRYKNLSLGLIFNYMYGHWVFDQAQDIIASDGGTGWYKAIAKSQLDRWQNPGDITDVPRRMPNDRAGYYNSSRMLQRGDFIRLKNMTISYDLPKAWISKMGIESVRAYAAGNNIFALTGLYFDPELPNSRGFSNRQTPPVRTISFGIEVSL